MTGRYGGPRKRPAPSFSDDDDDKDDTWKAKHSDVVRRVSRSPGSTSISVRGMLPDSWSLVHVSIQYDSIADTLLWKIKPLKDVSDDKAENS